MGLMKVFCWRIFEGILGGSFSNFQVQAAVFSIKARLDPLPTKPQRLQLMTQFCRTPSYSILLLWISFSRRILPKIMNDKLHNRNSYKLQMIYDKTIFISIYWSRVNNFVSFVRFTGFGYLVLWICMGNGHSPDNLVFLCHFEIMLCRGN